MRAHFSTFSTLLHSATVFLCMVLFVIMAFSTAATVALRYVLSSGHLWLQDLSVFAFGLLAILSLPVALFHDRHVRVDSFRNQQSAKTKFQFDVFAVFAMLVPLFSMLAIFAYGDVLASFKLGEGSPQIGGLPFYYIVKAGLPVSCILMMVQGVALLLPSSPKSHGER